MPQSQAGEQEKLNFTEYYSDGTYLYLSLKLEAPGEEKEIAWYSPEWYTDEKTRMGIDLSQVTVNGKQAETYKKLFLEKNGEGAYEGTWAVRLPEQAENGEKPDGAGFGSRALRHQNGEVSGQSAGRCPET